MKKKICGRENRNTEMLIRTENKGSITVEAAFVMPIVIFTVFALIYLSFYLHDICRIQSKLDLVLFKAGITVKHDADIISGQVDYEKIGGRGVFYQLLGNTKKENEQIQNYLGKELNTGLFLVKLKNISSDVKRRRVTISMETGTQVSLPGIKYLFEPFSKKVIEGKFPVHNPAETIRCTEVILETGSKIKGVDKIKERLEKIFGSK